MTSPAAERSQAILGDVGSLLHDLTEVQESLLAVLHQKRQAMSQGDLAGLHSLQPQEQAIAEQLRACYDRRSELLERGQSEGLTAESLTDMTNQLATEDTDNVSELRNRLQESRARVRTLQLEHLTNWVIAQKSLLHVSQMLEIVATGGKIKPTYGKEEYCARGSLVDHEA